MVEAIATQADLTREYLSRIFGVGMIPVYRAVLRQERFNEETGLLAAFRDNSPCRLIFSGTFSGRVAKEFNRKNTVRVQMPLSSIFDSWLTNPEAFQPYEDAGPPEYEYEIRYLASGKSYATSGVRRYRLPGSMHSKRTLVPTVASGCLSNQPLRPP